MTKAFASRASAFLSFTRWDPMACITRKASSATLWPTRTIAASASFLSSIRPATAGLGLLDIQNWPATPVLTRSIQRDRGCWPVLDIQQTRSEEHTSELQSHLNLVCRLLLE